MGCQSGNSQLLINPFSDTNLTKKGNACQIAAVFAQHVQDANFDLQTYENEQCSAGSPSMP